MKTYRKPTYHEVFLHVLKSVKKDKIPVKKINDKNGHTVYKTALPFSKTVQKVYFDTTEEIIKFTSLHKGKEKIDSTVKPKWIGDGKVSFIEIYT